MNGRCAIIAAALTSCAHEPDIQSFDGIITGSKASLSRFFDAAVGCGADPVLINRGAGGRYIVIGRSPGDPAEDPHMVCVVQWLAEHPEEELYFGDNERRN